MKYKYKLKQDSYSTGNGCDCCEPDYYEIWGITRIKSDGSEVTVHTNGTPQSLEDCYEAILRGIGVEIEIEYKEEV